MAKDQVKGATLKEAPLEALQQVAATHSKVVVTITRRNNKGQLASLGYNGIPMAPDDVLNLATWIEARAGGGTYIVNITSMMDVHTRLVPNYEIVIEGVPRPPMPLNVPMASIPAMPGAPAAPIVTAGGTALPPGYNPFQPLPGGFSHMDVPALPGVNEPARQTMSAWQQGVHPALQSVYNAEVEAARRTYGMPSAIALPPGASTASDMIALEQLRKAEAEKAQLQARLEGEQRRNEEFRARMEKEAREARDSAREREHQLQLDNLKMQMQFMGQSKPSGSPAEYAPLIAALAPILTALVTAGRDASTRTAEVAAQGSQRMLELLVSQANKPAPDPLAAVTALAPILALNKPDPTANLAQMEAMGSMQLQMLGMVAQMMETFGSQGGNEESPWMAIIKQVMTGVQQMQAAAQADQIRSRMLAANNPQQQQPMVQVTRPAAQAPAVPSSAPVSVPYETMSNDMPAAPQNAPVVLPQEAAISQLAAQAGIPPEMLDIMLPTEFRTSEWKMIILSLLAKREPDAISDLIARHISHLDDFGMLPIGLQEYHLDPQAAFRSLVQPLPVYTSDPAYCEVVIEGIYQAMLRLGVLQEAEDEGTDDAETGEDEESSEGVDEPTGDAPLIAQPSEPTN